MPFLRHLCLALSLLLACGLQAQDGAMWVAVGAQGRRVSSRDRTHWSHDYTWREGLLHAVAFGGGRFVAVGRTGGGGCACSTVDGEHWTEWPEACEMTAVAFGRARFIGSGEGRLFISEGAGAFTPGARLPWAGAVRTLQIACGDTEAGFRFAAIGEADLAETGEHVSWRGVTEDGTRWDHAVSSTSPARALAYGAGIFVIVGPGGLVETSHDGQAWERRDPGTTEDFTALVWSGTRFVAQGTHLWSSPDGITWQHAGTSPPKALLWAGEGLALGLNWQGQLVHSTDFTHWLPCEVQPTSALTALAFRPPR